MRKFLLSMMLLPLMAAAENYLVDGARWTSVVYPGDPPGEYPAAYHNSIEGGVTALGEECVGYRLGKYSVPLRVDGDKVYFLYNPSATEWSLLYDFSLQPGDVATVIIYDYMAYETDDPITYPPREFKVECTDRVKLPRYGDADVLIMDDYEKTGFGFSRPSKFPHNNKWVAGLGTPDGIFMNHGFRRIGEGAYSDFFIHFSIGDEIIFKNYSFDVDGSTAFLPYTIWKMECGDGFPRYAWFSGDVESGIFSGCLYKTAYYYPEGGDESMAFPIRSKASYIRVDGERIYRVMDNGPEALAYDFGIQPGEVRSIVPIDSERGDSPTWVRCHKRTASAAYPGHDEIRLEEFADEALTERIGWGIWISGIGSPFSVLYNNRFADVPVESNVTEVMVVGEPMWTCPAGSAPYAGMGAVTAQPAVTGFPAAYYNMQGQRIVEPAAPGVYVRVGDNGEISKILMK